MDLELDQKENEVLYNLLGNLNYYEIMAILCKSYPETELEEVRTILMKIVRKIQFNLC